MISGESRDLLESIKRKHKWLEDIGRPKILTCTEILSEISGNKALIRENKASKLLNRVLKQTTIESIW